MIRFYRCAGNASREGFEVSQGKGQVWVAKSPSEPFVARVSEAHEAPKSALGIARSLSTSTLDTFLPHGYPESVKDGYGKFVVGQAVGSVFSSAGGVLSMQVPGMSNA